MQIIFQLIIVAVCVFVAQEIASGFVLDLAVTIISSALSIYLFLRPQKGIYFIYLAAFFFNPYVIGSPFRMHLTHFIILISLLGLIVQNILLKANKWIKTPLDFPLIFFLCIYVFSFIHAENYNEFIKKIFILGMYLAGFFIATNVLKNKKEIDRFIKFMLYVTPVGVLYNFSQLLMHPFRDEYFRMYGEFKNPNDIADFLILVFPLLLCYMWKYKNIAHQIFAYISLSITLFGVIVTYSRASWFGLLFSLALIMVFSNKKILFFIFLIPFLFIGSYLIITETFYNIIQFKDSTLLARNVLWEKSVEIIKEYPIFGKGAGSFYENAVPYDSKFFTGAFNIFLTIWAEAGVFAVMVYTYVLLLILKTGLIHSYEKNKTFLDTIILGCFVGISAHAIHSLFEDMLFNVMTNWMYGIVTALLFCSVYIDRHGDMSENPYFSET